MFNFGLMYLCDGYLCLTIMLEYWKKAIDGGKLVGGLLTDLSKAFDCINHV